MKFDELPQIFNVLRGDMGLIGPRPEVPRFVDTADPRWSLVLAVRPGLFGISQILGRNESELYPEDCEDLEEFYRRNLLPGKLTTDGDYVRRCTLLYDLRLLVLGVMVSVFGTVRIVPAATLFAPATWNVTRFSTCDPVMLTAPSKMTVLVPGARPPAT